MEKTTDFVCKCCGVAIIDGYEQTDRVFVSITDDGAYYGRLVLNIVLTCPICRNMQRALLSGADFKDIYKRDE